MAKRRISEPDTVQLASKTKHHDILLTKLTSMQAKHADMLAQIAELTAQSDDYPQTVTIQYLKQAWLQLFVM